MSRSARYKRNMLARFDPRVWSNIQLQRFLSSSGSYETVLNASGWRDQDKEGSTYRNYFPKCTEYVISNHPDDAVRGASSSDDLLIDLLKEPSASLQLRFDCILNHTVLEHIRYPEVAVANLCSMTKGDLIIVVPFMQHFHFQPGQYGDYFRFTPMGLRSILEDNLFDTIYEQIGPVGGSTQYMFSVSRRKGSDSMSSGSTDLGSLELLNGHTGLVKGSDLCKEIVVRGTWSLARRIRKLI